MDSWGFNKADVYHKLDGFYKVLVELVVLEIVLWVICTVHHATRSAGCCSKVLLSCILKE